MLPSDYNFLNKTMMKYLSFFILFITISATALAQGGTNKKLFVIDSLPVFKDPEEWNEVLDEEIAYLSVLNNKDSLRILGYQQFDEVVFIFTKEYQQRPDSIRKIPSLTQMTYKDDRWYFRDTMYTGKYIDYFNNGKKQNEATLVNGKLHGEVKIYYKKGNLSRQSFYLDGKNEGYGTAWYKSGVLMEKKIYLPGKGYRSARYFPNGQLEYGNLNEKVDTAISYYSTGKIKKIAIIKNRAVVQNATIEKINYHQNTVYQCDREGDFKKGLKYCDKIIALDSLNETAYFYKGYFFEKQNNYDAALAAYDKLLALEPLSGLALVNRAFTRIKKFESHSSGINTNSPIPAEEVKKICADLQQAVYCELSGKKIDAALAKYCGKQ